MVYINNTLLFVKNIYNGYFCKDIEDTGNHGCFLKRKLGVKTETNVTSVCLLNHAHAFSTTVGF
jgi:hypothetical protein